MKSLATICAACIVAANLAVLSAQTTAEAEKAFENARHKEVIDGDLKGAIEQYRQVAAKFSKQPELAARALFQLGQCQEKLGQADAKKSYERIVREFAGQRQVAALAQARLASMNDPTATTTGITVRQLWADGSGAVPSALKLMPDGRSVMFPDWNAGDLATRDLVTGDVRRLGLRTLPTPAEESFEMGLYSPDQKQLALTHLLPDRVTSFDVVSTQPGSKPRSLIKRQDGTDVHPLAWSADGKSILAVTWELISAKPPFVLHSRIAWVSVADGTMTTVKALDTNEVGTISLSPDGRYIAYDVLGPTSTRNIFIVSADGRSETTVAQSGGIDKSPVWTPDGHHLVFISNRSRNFGLYAVAVQDGKGQGAPQLLKPDVGDIALSGFVRSGALYYIQHTGEQNVYRVELDPTSGKPRSAPIPLSGTYLTDNGMSAQSADGKRVAYLATRFPSTPPTLGGVSVDPGASAVVVKSVDGGVERSYSNDLMLSWAPMWYPGGDALLLAARRQPGGVGQAFYKLDLDSGRITPLLENTVNWTQPGAARGQREMSADGQSVYLSMNSWNEALKGLGGVAVVNLSTGETKRVYQADGQVQAVSLSPDNRSLAVTTGGKVVVMNADGSNPRTVVDESRPDGNLSGVSGVAWSSDGRYVLFVRVGNDGTSASLWRAPATGGEASDTGIQAPGLREIRSGPNGMLTYTAGIARSLELCAMDNLLPMLKAAR
jgi:Tol biopolymer transport system component